MKRLFLSTALAALWMLLATPLIHTAMKDAPSFTIREAYAFREGDPRLDRWLGVRTRIVRWCGVYLGKIVKHPPRGYASVDAWRRWGRRTPCRPGAIAVFRHRHVGLVTDVRKGQVRVKSGNDGNAIRNRWRKASSIRECRVK